MCAAAAGTGLGPVDVLVGGSVGGVGGVRIMLCCCSYEVAREQEPARPRMQWSVLGVLRYLSRGVLSCAALLERV